MSDGDFLTISDVESKHEKDWILDSTCAFHMYPNKDLFTTYETFYKCVVIVGTNVPYRVTRIGKVRLKLMDVIIITLSQVRHVPNLKKNLISLSILNSKDYEFFGEGGALKICKGAQVVLEGQNVSVKHHVGTCRI